MTLRLDPFESTPTTLEDWALFWVGRGYYIFPCYPKSKAPAGVVVPNGVLNASKDPAVISGWWKTNPNFNPAIALGPSNLVVRDFDTIKPTSEWPSETFTVKTGRLPVNGIEGIQRYYSGSCKTHGVEGGEIRSRGAYVMAAGAVHPSGNLYQVVLDLPLLPSPEKNEEIIIPAGPALGTDEQMTIGEYVEGAFDISNINYESRVEHDGGFKWYIACPWKSEHTTGKDFDTSSAVIMWPSGKLIYECKHGHCQGKRQWKELRKFMEADVGQRLAFGDPEEVIPIIGPGARQINTPELPSKTPAASIAPAANYVSEPLSGDYTEESDIPPFDPSVIGQDNIFRRFVDLISAGTGIPDQYAFAIAKAVVGMRMDGHVTFQGHDIRPNFYVALIGATGTGKSVAWKRMLDIIRPAGYISANGHSPCFIKLIDSFDSGAGLKDAFFEYPETEPILCFVDEVEDLGSKASSTRQPEILTTIIQLKEGTTISRILAKKPKRTKSDAKLGMVICGQEGMIFTKALAGRTKLGLWDRMYPEFAVTQESTNLPKIDFAKAFDLLTELNSLDYSITMTLSFEATSILETFWASLAKTDRKIRWKNDLIVDAFMSAFGRHAKEVSGDDVIAAVKIARRQIIIRKVCFTTEVPDKTGYYLGLIKRITEKMEKRLVAGDSQDSVAMSKRDYLTVTHAFRDNEDHWFEKAWSVHEKVFLQKVKVRKSNGQEYEKYLPSLYD
jgi:hypothetical protein